MIRKFLIATGTAALSLAISACGGGAGGGGGGLVSTPPPPPPPPTLTPQGVTIFANPSAQTFETVGVAARQTGSDATLGISGLSNADADQVHIRYTSGGYYEIEMPGASWDKLDFAKGIIPQDPSFANDFQPESAPQNGAHLITTISRSEGYKYSELAGWYDGLGRIGEIAFGSATPSGQVPVSGSATYQGIVGGTSDIVTSDAFDGYYRMPISGTVQLGFDFAKGSLQGSMDLSQVGSFDFTQTVFSAGSTTYSGKFDTKVAGDNYFLGQFTGPNAEETIGAWALPFLYSGDGQAHQAFGAWIAKQAP